MVCAGAIMGDICGSVYEFNNPKDGNIKLFENNSHFTDDTVLTCAVADWLIADRRHNKETLVEKLKEYSRKYPKAGYGGLYFKWMSTETTEPYNSYGNGSAMRVSPCGFYAKCLDDALRLAEIQASVTHNHPEGIKGARIISEAIFLAKLGIGKESIKNKLIRDFDYNLNKNLSDITHKHGFDATCQVTVPEALICFFESNSLEETITNAIKIGGDTDTIACMAGGVAEAYYGISAHNTWEVMKKLPNDLKAPLYELNKNCY